MTAAAANYRRAGITRLVLAYFIRDADELRAIGQAAGAPLRPGTLGTVNGAYRADDLVVTPTGDTITALTTAPR